jgi:uncharacterized membrane-anchored protein YitT (DUF2179 family)
MIRMVGTITSRFNLRALGWNYLLLTLGGLILAANAALFLAPANITPGGLLSVGIILNALFAWPIGTVMLILNIPMLVLGFQALGRFRFLTRTTYVVLLYSVGVDLLVQVLPPQGITDDLLLNALYGGVVGGIGTGLVYRGRGTAGGTGVLGRSLQIKTGIPISQIYLMTDGAIILTAVIVFGWQRALYAMMTLFIWGLVADYVLEGPSVIRTAFIVTDSPGQVAQAVFNRLGLGLTAWIGRGMFSEAEHTVLFCTVSRPDVNTLKEVVVEVDPRAFVVIGQGHQATGGVLRNGTHRTTITPKRQTTSSTG